MSRISGSVFLSCAMPHIFDLYLKVSLKPLPPRTSPMSWITYWGILQSLPMSSTSWLHLEAGLCPTKPWLRTMRLVGPRLLDISWMLWLEVFWGLDQSLQVSSTSPLAAGLCPGKPLLWKLTRATFRLKTQPPAQGKIEFIFQELCLEMFVFQAEEDVCLPCSPVA